MEDLRGGRSLLGERSNLGSVYKSFPKKFAFARGIQGASSRGSVFSSPCCGSFASVCVCVLGCGSQGPTQGLGSFGSRTVPCLVRVWFVLERLSQTFDWLIEPFPG